MSLNELWDAGLQPAAAAVWLDNMNIDEQLW